MAQLTDAERDETDKDEGGEETGLGDRTAVDGIVGGAHKDFPVVGKAVADDEQTRDAEEGEDGAAAGLLESGRDSERRTKREVEGKVSAWASVRCFGGGKFGCARSCTHQGLD